MCGIAGFVGWHESGAEEALRRMCDVIVHRGPDEEGMGRFGQAALGMRRLSIIDVAGGSQPIGNEDGTIQVVFNGEIYNFQEIRRRLERDGHRFATHADTEVLVHLYEERGPALVDELRGMFGFALWDARRELLLLGRDRLGKKPLYYRELAGGIAFASELKSLAAVGLANERPATDAIARYLALGYIPDPYSIYPSIRKLPPAHTLTWSRDHGVRVHRYWRPPAAPDPTLDAETAVVELRRLFQEAVRYRLIADVPIGAFLSGGVDSAAVVAEMARQTARPVETFTIGFEDARYNEAPAAAKTARALGTRHHELIVQPDVEEVIERVVCGFDEPFADSSALPTFLVSQLAAAHVKVVLSGDGGDELFGGYTRYTDFARRNWPVPGGARLLAAGLARLLPFSARGRGRLLELSGNARERYAGMVAHRLDVIDGGVARPEVAHLLSWDALLAPAFEEAAARDAVGQLLHVDLLTYLPGDILTKVDRMSMACSLEARVPLLDHRLVEFAMRIPTRLKVGGAERKIVFRRAVANLVPSEVFQRRKSGFALPLAEWLRGPLSHRLADVADPNSPVADYVSRAAVSRLVREHCTQRRDHSAMLWKLLVLDVWLRRQGSMLPGPSLALSAR